MSLGIDSFRSTDFVADIRYLMFYFVLVIYHFELILVYFYDFVAVVVDLFYQGYAHEVVD